MANFKARIRALEAKLLVDSITLRMADGSEHKIPADGQILLEAICSTMSGEPSPLAQLILKSVSDDGEQKGQGQLCALVRCFSHGPVETGSEVSE